MNNCNQQCDAAGMIMDTEGHKWPCPNGCSSGGAEDRLRGKVPAAWDEHGRVIGWANSSGASENVCPTCHGKGATAPNGVQYCNCDDSAPEPSERQPDGYAYRYPDGCIRFSGGREINGSDPVESIPYYFRRAPEPGGKDGWISVKDRMPPHDTDVLIWSPPGTWGNPPTKMPDRYGYSQAYWNEEEGHWVGGDEWIDYPDPTHWMPLPTPPLTKEARHLVIGGDTPADKLRAALNGSGEQ